MNDTLYGLFRPDLEAPTPADKAAASQAMMIFPVRWVEPRDVTNALLFLVSDEARHITGSAPRVDVGHKTK